MATNITGFDYEPIAQAFAKDATVGAGVKVIPNTSSATGADREDHTGDATMEFGFAPIYARPISDPVNPGKVVQRNELNGILKKATAYQAYQMNGGNTTFDPNLVAITGGYPKNAILLFYEKDSSGDLTGNISFVYSAIPNNSDDFTDSAYVFSSTSTWRKMSYV